MALCTQGDVEKSLQIDVSAEPDAAVTFYIENAEAAIKVYLDRDTLESAAVTETSTPVWKSATWVTATTTARCAPPIVAWRAARREQSVAGVTST